MRHERVRGAVFIASLAVLIGSIGCSRMSYRRVRIGADSATEVKAALPGDRLRTAYGYSFFNDDPFSDRNEAVVVILGQDDVAEAKCYVRSDSRESWFGLGETRRINVLCELGSTPNERGNDVLENRLTDLVSVLKRRYPIRDVSSASRLAAAGLVRVLEGMDADVSPGHLNDLSGLLATLASGQGVLRMKSSEFRHRIDYSLRETIRPSATEPTN
jgi:hypothetical protein